jgi:hypothetical protein
MGVDITLNSIWEPFFKNFESSVAERRMKRDIQRAMEAGDMEKAIQLPFDLFRASGGYFRNAFNGSDVMQAIGLSWDTVFEMLDAERRLPVERARKLIDMIEARPLDRRQYACHLMNYGNGPLQKMTDEAMGKPSPLPDLDLAFAFVSERREQLLAILRKSIELNEPLVVA